MWFSSYLILFVSVKRKHLLFVQVNEFEGVVPKTLTFGWVFVSLMIVVGDGSDIPWPTIVGPNTLAKLFWSIWHWGLFITLENKKNTSQIKKKCNWLLLWNNRYFITVNHFLLKKKFCKNQFKFRLLIEFLMVLFSVCFYSVYIYIYMNHLYNNYASSHFPACIVKKKLLWIHLFCKTMIKIFSSPFIKICSSFKVESFHVF